MSTGVELGRLLLAETQETLLIPGNNSFSQKLENVLFDVKIHKLNATALRFWLASFLITLPTVKNLYYPKIVSHRFTLDQHCVSLILVANANDKIRNLNASEVKRFTFCVDCTLKDDRSISIINRFKVEFNTQKASEFIYVLKKQEGFYHVETLNFVKCQTNLQSMIQNLAMPHISNGPVIKQDNILSFNKNLSQDDHVLKIMADFFAGSLFSDYVKSFGKTIDSSLLVLSIHAVLMGHFESQLNVESFAVFEGNERCSVGVRMSNSNAQLVMLLQSHEDRDFFVSSLSEVALKKTLELQSPIFVSFSVYSWENSFIWRQSLVKNQQIKEFLPTVFKSLLSLDDVVHFIAILNHALFKNLNRGELGAAMLASAQSDNRLTERFMSVDILTPNQENADYYTFIFRNRDLILIINLAENEQVDLEQSEINNLPKGILDDASVVNTINIVAESSYRKSGLNNCNRETICFPEFIIPGYHVSFKYVKTPSQTHRSPITKRDLITVNSFLSNNIHSLRSLEISRALTSYPKFLSKPSKLEAFLTGLLLSKFISQRISGNNLKLFKHANSDFEDYVYAVKIYNRPYFDTLTAEFDMIHLKYALTRRECKSKNVKIISIYIVSEGNDTTFTACQPSTYETNKTICEDFQKNENQKFKKHESHTYSYSSYVKGQTTDINSKLEKSYSNERRVDFSPNFKLSTRCEFLNQLHSACLLSKLGANVKAKVVKYYEQTGIQIMGNYHKTNLDICCEDFTEQLKIKTLPIFDSKSVVKEISQNRVYAREIVRMLTMAKTRNSSKILPSDQNGLFAQMTDAKNGPYLIFSTGNFQIIKGSSTKQQILFIDKGEHAVTTGEKDDIIILQKPSLTSGYINGMGGENTLILMTNNETSAVDITSNNNILLVKGNKDKMMFIKNVTHVLGRSYVPENLHVTCGLRMVNLRGGNEIYNDFLHVDVDKCIEKLTIKTAKYTKILHKSAKGNVKYVMHDGPVDLTFSGNEKTLISTGEIVVQRNFSDLSYAGIINSNSGMASLEFEYYQDEQDNVITFHNFTHLKVKFNDYIFEASGEHFQLIRDCKIHGNFDRHMKTMHMTSIPLRRISVNCGEAASEIYSYVQSGISRKGNTFISQKHIAFESDPAADVTRFEYQDFNEEGVVFVYELLPQIESKSVKIYIEDETRNTRYFDIRKISTAYEMKRYELQVFCTTENGEKLLRIVVWMNETGISLADIKFSPGKAINDKVMVITLLHSFEINLLTAEQNMEVQNNIELKKATQFMDYSVFKGFYFGKIIQDDCILNKHGDEISDGCTSLKGSRLCMILLK